VQGFSRPAGYATDRRAHTAKFRPHRIIGGKKNWGMGTFIKIELSRGGELNQVFE